MAVHTYGKLLVSWRGEPVEVTYKSVKYLRLRVMPPEGVLKVSSPPGVTESEIRGFLDQHGEWAQRARATIRARQPAAREFHDGATVPLWGVGHRIRFAGGVRAAGRREAGVITLKGADESARRRALDGLYRRELREAVACLLARWEQRVGRRATAVRLRRMKSRWGSCNTRTGILTFNLTLAETPIEALEGVVVHELVHLIERGHGPVFTAHMDRLLPDWRERRAMLSTAAQWG